MSSKILNPEQAQLVEPIVWPRIGPALPGHAGRAAERAPHPGAWETRLAELEHQHSRQVAEAHRRGFQEGEASSRAQAQAAIQPAIERLARTVEELAALRPHLRRDAEANLLKLAVEIARRVLRRELTADAEALRGVIQVALERLQSQEICRARVHPEQEAVLRRCLGQPGTARNIEILPDAALERGALIFETARGNLDASVETQLCEIERGLTDRLQRRS